LATTAASLVSASSGKQDEIVSAANTLRKQMEDLGRAGKASIDKAPEDKKKEVVQAITKAGSFLKTLLARVKQVHLDNTPENKNKLQTSARDAAFSINDIVIAVEALIPGGYVDPNDPNGISYYSNPRTKLTRYFN
jgi:talin